MQTKIVTTDTFLIKIGVLIMCFGASILLVLFTINNAPNIVDQITELFNQLSMVFINEGLFENLRGRQLPDFFARKL